MYILGISAFYHDSAAALLRDGEILAAAQEERFTRKKHDLAFPVKAAEYCLMEAGISIEDVDSVVFYDKPFVKFERLLMTYLTIAPAGWPSFIDQMPPWLKQNSSSAARSRRNSATKGNFTLPAIINRTPRPHSSRAPTPRRHL